MTDRPLTPESVASSNAPHDAQGPDAGRFYLSRGELRPCPARRSVDGWSEEKKDALAELVLKLVTDLTSPVKPRVVHLEPTSTGYLSAEVRPYVFGRMA